MFLNGDWSIRNRCFRDARQTLSCSRLTSFRHRHSRSQTPRKTDHCAGCCSAVRDCYQPVYPAAAPLARPVQNPGDQAPPDDDDDGFGPEPGYGGGGSSPRPQPPPPPPPPQPGLPPPPPPPPPPVPLQVSTQPNKITIHTATNTTQNSTAPPSLLLWDETDFAQGEVHFPVHV
ncbi:predicted protein [Chaetomium globosum CBS 148.51]|uniref:Uncharacterized protein n=1 Tax=Chaetomium globosum (strain ATCC 6205 / CBS 148.51 / DSM 1962 / NBRC 6347 / NRRL 1970) TaxID=306901 RepID=Q2H982_CHAGB|nr:uncharacterized protein CHGG_03222 [Chaetomium globosum CBS 148.51]EAQ91287.1 predicted protein [Chaetomium globosum CBS 148.51]